MHQWADLLGDWPAVKRSYNIAPSMPVAAFYRLEDQSRGQALAGSAMRWGMIPRWANAFESNYATFNARLESVEQKPTYRDAWRAKRFCVIPMAGYYEWQTNAQGHKQPFYITHSEQDALVAAALYEPWESHHSCTMLTREANEQLSHVHHRMPVLMTQQTALRWLSGELMENGSESAKLALMESDLPSLSYWPVGKAVGNPRNDEASLIQMVKPSQQ
jgi:putative SOS response-associated peptidase YedK